VTLFSYVVRWDHGFAPNPFHGVCSLATCKAAIRAAAELGDWVLGTGSASRDYGGHAIFAMRIDQVLTFDEYWSDPQWSRKRPVMNGSLKQRFGDDIYHRDAAGQWLQADSRHSWEDKANHENLKSDTGRTQRVLIGREFKYWGELAPKLPPPLRHFAITRPGDKRDFGANEIQAFLAWYQSFPEKGQIGDPLEWRYERWWR
jgi:Nucleotide modification associated domain 2